MRGYDEAMSYQHQWAQMIARDPEHSHRYAERWRSLAAAGHDLDGEARLIDAMAERDSRILDAGCGTGRVGAYLAARGHSIVGIDLDEVLISEARETCPAAEWHVGDLAETGPEQLGDDFDIAASAGNVMTFLDPASRAAVIANLASVLAPGGRLITGFGAGRGYDFDEYADDLARAGLRIEHRFATWTLQPFAADSDFLVCVSVRT